VSKTFDYGTMFLHPVWTCHCVQFCFWNSTNQ